MPSPPKNKHHVFSFKKSIAAQMFANSLTMKARLSDDDPGVTGAEPGIGVQRQEYRVRNKYWGVQSHMYRVRNKEYCKTAIMDSIL